MSILKKFDHIGIVVKNLSSAMDQFSSLFGFECQEQMQIEEAGIRIAFYPLGSGRMELIEFQRPLNDLDPLVTQPGAGVQHVAFQVDDFEAALKELCARGLKVVKGFPRRGAHGLVAFFYPTAELDLLIEICQAQEQKTPEIAAGT